MAPRCSLLVTLIVANQADDHSFCHNGLEKPNFDNDGGKPSVNLVLAQAPLYSANPDPRYGALTEFLGEFHTALIFQQGERVFTLEFDATAKNLFWVIAPSQNQNASDVASFLRWDQSDARYCLTKGIHLGKEHWTHTWSVATTLTVHQVEKVFNDFIMPLNSTGHGHRPQYQAWHVRNFTNISEFIDGETLVDDVTCADGAKWVLHYAREHLASPMRPDFVFAQSVAVLAPEGGVIQIFPGDESWPLAVYYFSFLGQIIPGGQPSLNSNVRSRLGVSPQDVPGRFVYDTNSGMYYHLQGRIYMRPVYEQIPLGPPPCSAVEDEILCQPVRKHHVILYAGLTVAALALLCVAIIARSLIRSRFEKSHSDVSRSTGVSLVDAA